MTQDQQAALAAMNRMIEERVTAKPHTSETCVLCGYQTANSWEHVNNSGQCRECAEIVNSATDYRWKHAFTPKRYRNADATVNCGQNASLLLIGAPGTGKTYTGYSLLRAAWLTDPRVTAAAYSWPELLMELRRGYSASRDAERRGQVMSDALRESDIAMIDDLGAHKVTEGNQAWIQQELFVILDARWANERRTILTSNLGVGDLARYLGDRIASRISGMCEVIHLDGPDRRLGA